MTPGYPYGPKNQDERYICQGKPNENLCSCPDNDARVSERPMSWTPEIRWGIATFIDDEGGFTSVAVALALLVSLCLVFECKSLHLLHYLPEEASLMMAEPRH